MEQKSLLTEKTGRFYLSGGSDRHIRQCWVVLHGYGQLAYYFLQKFDKVADQQTLLVAPEGLHRFYHSRHTRVGASWMTREDRENDIRDYLYWLDKVYEQVIEYVGDQDFHLKVLGFSQGAATASRWALHKYAGIGHLILWGGLLPPDIDFAKMANLSHQIPVTMVNGDNDQTRNSEKEAEEFEFYRKKGLILESRNFSGSHELDYKVLAEIKNKSFIH